MGVTVPVVPVIKIPYGVSDALLKSWSLKNVKVCVASSYEITAVASAGLTTKV